MHDSCIALHAMTNSNALPVALRDAWRLIGAAAAAALLPLLARPAAGQLPGLPILQGAFAGPGLAAGVDAGRADERTMTAVAVGYGTRSGRVGLVAGVGFFGDAAAGFRGSRVGYGGRVGVTAVRLMNERLAVTPFAGFGSWRGTLASGALSGLPVIAGDTGTTLQFDEIPIGVSAGWRLRLGATNAVAVSVAPAYTVARRAGGSLDANKGYFRVATVADVAVAGRFGVTLAGEFGQTAQGSDPGPQGSRIGLGVSYAFLRR